MDTSSTSKAERMAKVSRVLGILSVALLVIGGAIFIYVRFFFEAVDWVSGLGYAFFALLVFLGSVIIGLGACITAWIALKRNKEGDDDQAVKKMANLGLVLGLVSVVLILGFFAFAWIVSSNTPPPDISTPIPPKTAP